ncbi:MAG: hypothetical protein OXB86_00840 [Bdellovibrionales bacterium]|nr:hypothetical protein [Bdellovibrionales bacterium]
MRLVLVFFCLCICFEATAAPRKSKKRSRRAKVVDIDFDDELRVKGKLLGPGLFTLFQRKNLQYGQLIKPRKNFLPEMRATLGDIE